MKELLSPREKELLTKLQQVTTVRQAAHRMRIEENTAYTMLARIREKYLAARQLVNQILVLKRNDKLINKVLTVRVKVEDKEIRENE